MKKTLLFITAALAVSCANTKSIDANAAGLLAKYSKTITETELKDHLYTVASDAMQGRETGSDGQKAAGQYLIEQ